MKEIMDQAIFRTTSQALHFSYVIQAYEPSAESVMAKVVRRLMKESGVWDVGAPSTVNFDGLNALEVRAQCAMIRAAVHDRLPGPECWVIQARYGINDIVAEDGQRKYCNQEKFEAILNLADWMRPSLRDVSPLAVDHLVANATGGKGVRKRTLRELAEQFGKSKDTWRRSLCDVRRRLDALENLAIDRLTPGFVAEGIVAP
ncbi:MAG: hypothetical protein LBR95_08915 [Azoarcus sp.]|jgi:hypothetical protein|nr:hypothetical protein [Azoarcus sp.]